MRKRSLEYIIPAIIALVITIVVIRFIPVLSEKNQLKLISSESVPPDDYFFYYDMNGD